MNHYVWDIAYIDAPVMRYHDADANGDFTDPGDDTRYYTYDANWNVTGAIDEDGTVLARYGYDPYGMATEYAADWTGGTAPSEDGPLYAGYFFDAETGLYHVRNRQYQADTGKFLQRDPIGYSAGDSNLTRYVGSSPLSAIDPMGLAVVNLQNGNASNGQGSGGIGSAPLAGLTEFGGNGLILDPSTDYNPSTFDPELGELKDLNGPIPPYGGPMFPPQVLNLKSEPQDDRWLIHMTGNWRAGIKPLVDWQTIVQNRRHWNNLLDAANRLHKGAIYTEIIGIPEFIDKLKATVDDGVFFAEGKAAGTKGTMRFDAENNRIETSGKISKLTTSLPHLMNIVHETVHAYNFANGFHQGDQRADEGMAYGIAAIVTSLTLPTAFSGFEMKIKDGRFGAVGSAGRRDAIQAAWTNIWKAGGTVDIVKSLHQVNGRYFTIPWHGKTKNYHPFVVADRDYREIADKAGISISCSALANAYSALAGIEDCPLQCPKSLDDTPFE